MTSMGGVVPWAAMDHVRQTHVSLLYVGVVYLPPPCTELSYQVCIARVDNDEEKGDNIHLAVEEEDAPLLPITATTHPAIPTTIPLATNHQASTATNIKTLKRTSSGHVRVPHVATLNDELDMLLGLRHTHEQSSSTLPPPPPPTPPLQAACSGVQLGSGKAWGACMTERVGGKAERLGDKEVASGVGASGSSTTWTIHTCDASAGEGGAGLSAAAGGSVQLGRGDGDDACADTTWGGGAAGHKGSSLAVHAGWGEQQQWPQVPWGRLSVLFVLLIGT